MARAASLDTTPWLPTYGWWPPSDSFDLSVVLTPFHSAIEPDARFTFTLRGYHRSNQPLWEHEVPELRMGEEAVVRLAELDVPDPPPDGGIVEVHGIRHDKAPRKGTGFIGQWLDAQAPAGGGYICPTIPIRAQAKAIARDDVQVIPGIVASAETETVLVLLNVVDEPTEVRLVASSPGGLLSETQPFTIQPWTAWRGSLNHAVPRVRRLLGDSDGIGSLAIHSSHRLLPYFGFSHRGGPLLSLDHTAPIFA
jgi:hypothetical protein